MNRKKPKPDDDAMLMRSIVFNANRNMRFVALFTMVYGGLTCLSVVGAIIGVPLIIAGTRLREAANALEQYAKSGEAGPLQTAIDNGSRYFAIQKALIIVSLVFTVIYLVAIVVILGNKLALF